MSGRVHFCWSCYAQLPGLSRLCPRCGGPTEPPADATQVQLQLWSLGHPLVGRRMIALAALERSPAAAGDSTVVEAVRALVNSADPYLAARALQSLHALAGADSWDVVQRAAEEGSSAPVRRVARDLLAKRGG